MSERQALPPHGAPLWMEIFATDLDRARSFYSAVFDWTFSDHPTRSRDEYIVFNFPYKPGSPLSGGIIKVDEPQKTSSGSPLTYFVVDDLTKARERVVANGGKEISSVEPEDWAFIVRCEDTEGNRIGLFSAKR